MLYMIPWYTNIFFYYMLMGALMILLYFPISNFFYKLVLLFTDKINVSDLFLFRVDSKNKNTMLSLMHGFVILFGGVIFALSLYLLLN